MEVEMTDKPATLSTFIENLPKDSTLYVDLEGNNLSHHGTLSLITILVEPRPTVHLIDVTILGKEALSTPSGNGSGSSIEGQQTHQQILESSEIPKIFFNIRNDSDALFSLFGIRIAGIEDLQLMESGTRTGSKRLIKGLAKAIEQDARLSAAEIKSWKEVKESGKRLFVPELCGNFAVFDQRRLSAEIVKYSVQDVLHMPALRRTYLDQLGPVWKAKVEEEGFGRIALSQSAGFNGRGRDMAEGPEA